MSWLDERLSFEKREDIPEYFKRYGLNVTEFSSRIFTPRVKISNQISSKWLS